MRKFRLPRHTGFLSILLTFFGLGATSCVVMYGSPTADWSVKGKVVDETGKCIPDLQVVLTNHFPNTSEVIYDQNDWPMDTLRTGTDGSYGVEGRGFPLSQLKVEVQDVDGEANGGTFADVTLVIKNFEYKDGKGWYEGHAEITVPDIVAKKQ